MMDKHMDYFYRFSLSETKIKNYVNHMDHFGQKA